MLSSTGQAQAALASKSKVAAEQAAAALRAGNSADAEQTLRRHLLTDPTDLQAVTMLADLLDRQGRRFDATLVLKQALATAPRAHELRLALARMLEKQGLFDAALAEVQALGEPLRRSFVALILEAAVLGYLGRHEEQLRIYQDLQSRFPDRPHVWMYYGNALKTIGRTEEAVRALFRAAKLRPDFGEPYWNLANLKTFRFRGRDIAAMRKALRKNLDDADAIHFHFALGKAFEERGEPKQSFHHYAEGNRLRASQLPSTIMRVTERAESVVKVFTKELFEGLAGCGHMSRDPIFVVGLQRSGSTLIEQILASHPLIEGTSELTIIEQFWHRWANSGLAGRDPFGWLLRAGPDEVHALGVEYMERASAFRRTDKPLFVDKLPGNWLNVGLIQLILPNAKIIDARRHPMACGFSNFKQLYATGVFYSYSMEAIGRFYRDYLHVMDHFDRIQPGKVHHVLNERLIDEPEKEVRRVLEYIGVAYDPACLDFHKNRRAVQTPSSEQVRRPINRDGVDSWRRFEPSLGPLSESLGDALERWDHIPG